MALVNYSRCCLEACPHFLAQFLCNRAGLTELLMQLLQLVECAYHVFLSAELFGSLAYLCLYFKILLEVVFACLAV